MYNSEMYYERKAAGICGRCGNKPSLPNRVKCEDCAKKHNKEQRLARNRKISMRICTICDTPLQKGDNEKCKDCLNDRRIYATNRRRNLKHSGKCPHCGVRESQDNFVLCIVCMNLYNRKYYERKKNGLCVKCCKPNDTKNVRCSKCSKQHSSTNRRRREKAWSNGSCSTCNKRPAKGDGRTCEHCLEKAKANYYKAIQKKSGQ